MMEVWTSGVCVGGGGRGGGGVIIDDGGRGISN